MRPLKHGYTNRTVADARTVVKRYEGPDADSRMERERLMLDGLRAAVPVPPVLGKRGGALELGLVAGTPGQELMETDRAADAMRSCGRVLRRIHDQGTDLLGSDVDGQVLVHGDFGPNNLLLDPVTCEVTAVVDWEFAHVGDPVEDLAWCEWIVRTHHPDRIDTVDGFFAAYAGPVPDWPIRKAAMLTRCAQLEAFCRRRDSGGPAVRQWQRRAAATAAW
ncbi:phosphotransferase family protein [Glycomyces buryatensis]|uniref:Aminoglycoside phosphotransferase n=1 Tax=Glycomyces buryatensis TaxID=2570927 RepID=A0A4S8Q8I8_9ACTN|nr:phosphotransferase [Glycomyces buryatensis]THV40490.1 aminoglycoside phosphotransferase [Glycomyces buryatensis]